MTKTVILASGNPGKLREFNILLQQVGFNVKPQSEFDVSNAEETGLSFIENAIIKARHACANTGHPAIADDSGIEVDALQGAPGIYSARYSGEGANDQTNNQKLLDALKDVPEKQRTARYQCLLVFMQHENDPTPIIAQGSWEGRILEKPMGDGGFGYDPIFWVPTHNCSSAQMSKEEKNRISHRAIAMQSLMQKIRGL
ncbi:RdgB/HAM1 family non-canonical purine NTP pyrophosphatase [Agarilytica rhodophyticola]|uniref:RdgB/HAM1 family non-canonical purine NTP pyrophosphatase n=1 Tax=Agarilytica rhodophyticola TaxID=1737490 RepID=UPI000B34100D|nr:RdgB/HAM1 family non-canonical purine NTP pyrophosphatase [Agarilytica rhodophyticola]